jgi:hypothetical protein
MENEIDILSRRMIRAIGTIQQFADRTYNFDTGKDFMTIHNFNIDGLKQLAQLRKNDFYTEKLSEYPTFDEDEIDFALMRRHRNRLVKARKKNYSCLRKLIKVCFTYYPIPEWMI